MHGLIRGCVDIHLANSIPLLVKVSSRQMVFFTGFFRCHILGKNWQCDFYDPVRLNFEGLGIYTRTAYDKDFQRRKSLEFVCR